MADTAAPRSPADLLSTILAFAVGDERIRAVSMEGSRAATAAIPDTFSDLDLTFYVRDVRTFVADHAWIDVFGQRLILQMPDDWHDHPYDYSSGAPFGYLIQFADGNRLDLTLVGLQNLSAERENREPRRILLDKDGFTELSDLLTEDAWIVKAPAAKEFGDVINEFRWLSLYVAKGLARGQFFYARRHFDDGYAAMYLRLLIWHTAWKHRFAINPGAFGKYLERYIPAEEMARIRANFPAADSSAMWAALLGLYDDFALRGAELAAALGFPWDEIESGQVRAELERRKALPGST